MPSNRINNNEETILMMDLEILNRIYNSGSMDLSGNDLSKIGQQINSKLKNLDDLRGFMFDTDASVKQWLEENK